MSCGRASRIFRGPNQLAPGSEDRSFQHRAWSQSRDSRIKWWLNEGCRLCPVFSQLGGSPPPFGSPSYFSHPHPGISVFRPSSLFCHGHPRGQVCAPGLPHTPRSLQGPPRPSSSPSNHVALPRQSRCRCSIPSLLSTALTLLPGRFPPGTGSVHSHSCSHHFPHLLSSSGFLPAAFQPPQVPLGTWRETLGQKLSH